jgi:hypothetical protein
MTEVVYEDEILPEIEIRELLTLEQMLEANPSFVAFTRNEILQHLFDLVPPSNATALTDEIYRIVTQPTSSSLRRNVIPVLRADKIRYDETELDTYEQLLNDIKRAPNYAAQQYLLNKLTYPLEHVAPLEDDPGFTSASGGPKLVGYGSDPINTTVLLPSDNVEQAIAGAVYVPASVTCESYLYERASAPVSSPPSQFIETRDINSVRPTFQNVLQNITHIPDIHVLKHTLLRFDYDFDTLTNDQLAALLNHIRTLRDIEDTTDTVATNLRTSPFSVNMRDFYDALKSGITMPSLDKEKYNAIYNAISASIEPPQLASVPEVPLAHGSILEGLQTNKFTLPEVAAFFKTVRNRMIIDAAFATLQRYMEIDPEAIPENIETIVKKWNRCGAKYNDRTARVFLELYKDVTEIKKGADTSMYDGNPMQQPDQIFEEMQYEYVDQTTNEEETIVTEESVAVDGNYPDGVKEVMIPIIRKMHALSRASGIPVSLSNMTSSIAPRIVRLSFEEMLQQLVPELSQETRSVIASGNYESAMRIAMGILPVPLGTKVQEIVRKMYKEYTAFLKQLFIELFSWYVLTTQEAILEKRLDFDPMTHGMLACIRSWGPYGAPLTKEKDKVGVIYYLAAVAHESAIIEEYKWTADELAKAALAFISEHRGSAVEQLQTMYGDVLNEHQATIQKAREANVSLNEAIQMKLKKRILPDFVRAFLYLPLIKETLHQKLGPEFVADSDWQDQKKLKAVKDQLAKKRMTKAERPPLAWMAKEEPDAVVVVSAQLLPPRVEYDQNQASSFTQWLETCKSENIYLLPPDVIASDPASITNSITRNLNAVVKTLNKRSTAPITVSELTMKHLDVVATSLYKTMMQYDNHDEPEYRFLERSISHIGAFKRKWATIPVTRDPIELSLIDTFTRYVVTRAACLPCDSRDANDRTGKLSLSDRVTSGFVTNTLSRTFNSLATSFQNGKMPTLEDQQAFITKMREIQKVQTLQILNNQTEEERLLMVEAKKLGLYKPTIDYSNVATIETEYQEEEPEYRYEGEDPSDMVGDDLL